MPGRFPTASIDCSLISNTNMLEGRLPVLPSPQSSSNFPIPFQDFGLAIVDSSLAALSGEDPHSGVLLATGTCYNYNVRQFFSSNPRRRTHSSCTQICSTYLCNISNKCLICRPGSSGAKPSIIHHGSMHLLWDHQLIFHR